MWDVAVKFIFSVEGLKAIIPSLISVGVVLLVSSLNFRSKRKEIKLTGFYKDRIEAVKELYSLLVTLHFAHKALFDMDYIKLDHDLYKKLLLKWLNDFEPLYEYYARNRILLVDDNKYNSLSKKVRENLNHIGVLKWEIYAEYQRLIDIEDHYGSDLNIGHYGDEQDEVVMIVRKRTEFSTKIEFAWIISSFVSFRETLEAYFKLLVE